MVALARYFALRGPKLAARRDARQAAAAAAANLGAPDSEPSSASSSSATGLGTAASAEASGPDLVCVPAQGRAAEGRRPPVLLFVYKRDPLPTR